MHSKTVYNIDINLDVNKLLKNFLNKDNQYTIPIFIPHKGCPNNCIFCNQKRISGVEDTKEEEVKNIIETHLQYFKDSNKNIEIAFFGGSFTGIDINLQNMYLKSAYEYIKDGRVKSIRLSTRPDYINDTILKNLKKYGVKNIELGVQSMDDNILEYSKRGHTREDVIKASNLIKLYGFNLGHQVMIGLPGSTLKTEIDTIKSLLKLNPNDLRIYPVYVLQDSELYDMYENKEYIPLTIDEAIERVYYILKECIKTDVKIIRLGLQSTNEITASNKNIAGPVCDNFAEYVMARIIKEYIEENLINEINKKFIKLDESIIHLNIHANNYYSSVIYGPKKVNKEYFYNKYNCVMKIR